MHFQFPALLTFAASGVRACMWSLEISDVSRRFLRELHPPARRLRWAWTYIRCARAAWEQFTTHCTVVIYRAGYHVAGIAVMAKTLSGMQQAPSIYTALKADRIASS